MNKISEYLENDPNYYIDWGENIITNLDEVNYKVNKIISKFESIKLDNWINIENKNWKIIFFDKKNWSELWRNLYIDINDWYWYLTRSILWDWVEKFKWYWKAIYILTALEAYKSNSTFISDIIRQTTKDGKYVWNSLVNLWLVEYDENMKRFKFINEMLEDYFSDKIKNTD